MVRSAGSARASRTTRISLALNAGYGIERGDIRQTGRI